MGFSRRIICFCPSQPTPLGALAEACLQLSPQLAVRGEEALFLEIGASRRIFSEEGARARLLALVRRFQLQGRIGVADTAAHALALARWEEEWRELPLSALALFASPFAAPDDLPRKQLDNMVLALERLGVRNLGDFVKLPVTQLGARFGRESLLLRARLCEGFESAWPGFHPPEKIQEAAASECENLEALVFILKGLMDRAMARLRGRGERATAIEVALQFEKWSTLKRSREQWRMEFPLPQGSAAGILPIVQEKLAHAFGKRPLPAPVAEVFFEVSETVPGRGAQTDFFSRREEEAEAWNSLVGRLAQKFGETRAFTAVPVARYLPERSYKRVCREIDEQKSTQLEAFLQRTALRPSRVLRRPELLSRNGAVLVHPAGRKWKTLRWEGPERLCGEWWEKGFSRDYYRVTAESGELLWIFVNNAGPQPALYLHGYFD